MHLTETESTEYKRRVTDNIEKSVIGFLNSSGGELQVGVDPDGSVCGVDNYDEEVRGFTDRVKNKISPSALGLFSVSPRMGKNGKVYLIIKIASGSEKPYYLNEYGMSPKGCFIRVGTQTSPMTQNMIDTLYARRSLHTLHNTISPNQSLTFEQLRIYYNETGFTVTDDTFLENLDLYTEDGKFNYLAYLMADRNGVSVKIAQYAGTDKVTILQKTECGHCSLIKATKCILSAVEIYNKTAVEITPQKRIDTRLVDPVVLREAFLNSVLHNDYVRGAYPVVEFYSDRVEITSSGGLPLGLTKEEFFRGRSYPRNRELMRIFKDMGLCEQLGSGMKRILEKYTPEDYEISENFVVACFKYNQHALEVMNASGKTGESREGHTFVSTSSNGPSSLEMEVYRAIYEGKYTTAKDMATSLGVSLSSIEKTTAKLKDKGLIQRAGSDKKGTWELVK